MAKKRDESPETPLSQYYRSTSNSIKSLDIPGKTSRASRSVISYFKSIRSPDFGELRPALKKARSYVPTETLKQFYHKKSKPKPQLKGGFVLDWNSIFGWWGDPFQEKVLEPIEEFFIEEIKKKNKINLFILKTHRFGTITGDEGSGKSILLKWIREELDHHKKKLAICFISDPRKSSGSYFIKDLIRPVTGTCQRVFKRPYEKITKDSIVQYMSMKIKDKTLFILIDDAEKLTKYQVEILNNLLESSLSIQILVAGEKDFIKNTHLGTNEKDMLKISLKTLSFEHTEKMILKRITYFGGEKIFPFTQKALKKLYDKARGNPKKLLNLCHERSMQLSLKHREKLIRMRKELEIKRKEEEVKQRALEKESREQEDKMWEERRKTKEKVMEKEEDSVLGFFSKDKKDKEETKPEKQENIEQEIIKSDGPSEEEIETYEEQHPNSPKDELELDKLDQAISKQLESAEKKDKATTKQTKEDNSELERNEELFADLFADEKKTKKKVKKK